MRMRRISPPPRKNPVALANVGAAVIAVAANAPNTARLLRLLEQLVIYLRSRTLVVLPAIDVTITFCFHPHDDSESMTQPAMTANRQFCFRLVTVIFGKNSPTEWLFSRILLVRGAIASLGRGDAVSFNCE